MLLDTIEAFKKKILAWTSETQYASLISIIIINEIFGLCTFELKERIWYSYSITYADICIILYTVFLNTIIQIIKIGLHIKKSVINSHHILTLYAL